jgi:molybdopterin molybdotransferase
MTPLGPSPLIANDRHLRVDEARAAVLQALVPVDGTDIVPLAEAIGRVLGDDLVSPMDVPPHDNSAMDGYAFDGAALPPPDGPPLRLRVVGSLHAGGGAWQGAVPPGACLRIMTGAVMPQGLDTVVPQELVHDRGPGAGAASPAGSAAAEVEIPAGVVQRGENRRRAGEDLARGRVAIAAGRVLRPSDLGLAASLGFATLQVRRRLRVALISTGDELRDPGAPLPPGCIYDSNRASLTGALRRLGVEVVDMGLVPDDPVALEKAFTGAAAACDAIVTSGGVSVGDADHTRALLARLGEVAFWKVAMRPGRPFAFGALRSPAGAADPGAGTLATGAARDPGRPAWLFALPGNPVAALVTFYAFVREALLVLSGARAEPLPVLPVLRVRSAAPIRKRPGRTEFQRAVVEPGADGHLQVRTTGAQGAGILRSLSQANALMVLGHDQGPVAAGDLVDVWMFDGLA